MCPSVSKPLRFAKAAGIAAVRRLRLVSIAHPACHGGSGAERLSLLGDLEVTVVDHDLLDHALLDYEKSSFIRRISMPTRGRARAARFPSLAAALTLLNPNIVHLQADPDTLLARDVSRLCRKQSGRGLVLDSTFDGSPHNSLFASLRARRTLAHTACVIARSEASLSAIRRLGFTGYAVVAGHGQQQTVLPRRDEARRLLQLPATTALVVGWAGPLDGRSGVIDLLEAVAACDDVAVVIALGQPGVQDIADRADALEILPQIRFAPPEAEHAALAGIDALILAPPRDARERTFCLSNIALAQTHAIPVIHADLPELIELAGPGGWPLPPGDPALLARLFNELAAQPALLEAGAAFAASHAARRHSPEAAAIALARAIHAADPGHRAGPAHDPWPRSRLFAAAFRRAPSRT